MKKIISLFSALALIGTMFTTVAMADTYENKVYFKEIDRTSDNVVLGLYLETKQDLSQATIAIKMADYSAITLSNSTVATISSTSKTTWSNNLGAIAATWSGAYLPDVSVDPIIYTGNYKLAEFTVDLTKLTADTTLANSTSGKKKTSVKSNTYDSTGKAIDITSDFDLTGLNYTVTKSAGKTDEVTSFTMTPDTKDLKGGEKADFTVAIDGKGNYDGFEYKVVNGAGTDVTADVTTLAGKVITFKAPPASFDDDQTFTITATSTVDSTKTATATVTVAKAGRTGTMVNPADGKTNKTYITDVVEFNTNTTAPEITIKDETGDTRTFKGDWYPTNLKGQGTINVLVIVRYAGETEKTFSIVNE